MRPVKRCHASLSLWCPTAHSAWLTYHTSERNYRPAASQASHLFGWPSLCCSCYYYTRPHAISHVHLLAIGDTAVQPSDGLADRQVQWKRPTSATGKAQKCISVPRDRSTWVDEAGIKKARALASFSAATNANVANTCLVIAYNIRHLGGRYPAGEREWPEQINWLRTTFASTVHCMGVSWVQLRLTPRGSLTRNA